MSAVTPCTRCQACRDVCHQPSTVYRTVMIASLQQLIDKKQQVTTDELNLPENKAAATELQRRLCDLGILDPVFKGDKTTPFGPVAKADAVVGPMTRNALYEFCRLANIKYVDKLLTPDLLKALVVAVPDTFLPV